MMYFFVIFMSLQTFLRQKITLASSRPASTARIEEHRDSKVENDSLVLNASHSLQLGVDNVDSSEHVNEKKIAQSISKVSKDTTSVGALRYALQLRFLCLLPKKSARALQRCKSDPLFVPSRNMESDGERHFYLYNDLRVVFPQRHLDADEGKVYLSYIDLNLSLVK